MIGFDNGVYDLSIGKFREKLPEDNLIFNTGINYKKFNDDRHLKILALLSIKWHLI